VYLISYHYVFQSLISSRASAAALSTVLRTTTLSCRNMRFSGTYPAETPQPINMKFCTIEYVGKVTRCAKIDWNRLIGCDPAERWNITSKTFLTIPYLTLSFLLLNASTTQTAQPIYTHDGWNDAFCSEKVLFGGRIDTTLHFRVETPQKPKFWNWNAKYPVKSI
jgi:hypothetical protein